MKEDFNSFRHSKQIADAKSIGESLILVSFNPSTHSPSQEPTGRTPASDTWRLSPLPPSPPLPLTRRLRHTWLRTARHHRLRPHTTKTQPRKHKHKHKRQQLAGIPYMLMRLITLDKFRLSNLLDSHQPLIVSFSSIRSTSCLEWLVYRRTPSFPHRICNLCHTLPICHPRMGNVWSFSFA